MLFVLLALQHLLPQAALAANTWTATNSLTTRRSWHKTTLLAVLTAWVASGIKVA